MKAATVLVAAAVLAVPAVGRSQISRLDSLRREVVQHPRAADAHIALAEAYLALGRQREAITELEQALELDSTRTDARELLAQLYAWNNMPQKAASLYEHLLQKAPGDTALMHKLAQYYIWADQGKKALPLLEELVRRRPGDRNLRLALAQQCLWNGKASCAAKTFAALLKENPRDTLVVHGLVQSLFAVGDNQKALKVYRYLLRLAPARVDWWLDYAQQCAWNNRWEEAIRAYTTVLKHQPQNRKAWKGLVDVLMWSGRQREASRVLERWLALHPKDTDARWQLVQLLDWTGAPSNQVWSQVIRLLKQDPEHLNARELVLHQFGFPGREWSTKWQETHDSNDLTITTTLAELSVPWKPGWVLVTRGWHRNFVERRPDTSAAVWGAGGEFLLRRGLGLATWISAAVEGTSYATHWVPTGYRLALHHRFGLPIVAAVQLWRHESREGAFALVQAIDARGWETELRYAPSTRLLATVQGDLIRFSDGNRKVDWFLSGSYRLRQSRPGLTVEGYLGYEDFSIIYPNSIPYWTPDGLVHQSVGLSLDHALGDRLTVGLGLALARNPGYPLSSNVRASLSYRIASALSLLVEYYDFGSTVYRSSTLLVRVFGGF